MQASTTADRLRQVLAETIQLDAGDLRRRVGQIVLTTSDDPAYQELLRRAYPPSTLMALRDPGDVERDPGTIFFVDRIPAGIERQVVLREIAQLHAWDAKPEDWKLLAQGVERWDTWGGVEGATYKAVAERKALSRHVGEKVDVVFTLQELLKRKVVPDLKGIGASGWLHAAIDTARESMQDLTGGDFSDYGSADLVKLFQIGTPFSREIDGMRAAQRAQRRDEELKVSRAQRMEVLDAKYLAVGEAPAAKSREQVLLDRVAELTERFANAKSSVESMASEGHDGRWYASCYYQDEVTSLVVGVSAVNTMRSALWDIKELVGKSEKLRNDGLVEVCNLAYAGLDTGVGAVGERAALKEILAGVLNALDTHTSLDGQVVLDAIASGAPLLVGATTQQVQAVLQVPAGLKLKYGPGGEQIELAGRDPASSEQRAWLDRANAVLDDAVHKGLDSACWRIQEELGINAGDYAAVHFATGGPQERQVRSALAGYLIEEVERLSLHRLNEAGPGPGPGM